MEMPLIDATPRAPLVPPAASQSILNLPIFPPRSNRYLSFPVLWRRKSQTFRINDLCGDVVHNDSGPEFANSTTLTLMVVAVSCGFKFGVI